MPGRWPTRARSATCGDSSAGRPRWASATSSSAWCCSPTSSGTAGGGPRSRSSDPTVRRRVRARPGAAGWRRPRHPPEVAIVTVLLAYIRTPEGDAALAAATEEGLRRSTAVVLVNVTRPADQVDAPYSSEQLLDAAAEQLRRAGVEVEVRQLPAGVDPADAIIAVAEETGPDLVVIGLRRRTAVGKLIVGSTSQRILLGVGCPVLAVK